MLLPALQGKVLVLGIGNSLKQDDGAGPHFVRKFQVLSSKFQVLNGGVAPENFTGKIKQIRPDTLVIVDAIDFGGRPGGIKIFDEEEFGVRSFSTHNVSLKTFVGFLKEDFPNLNVIIVGIQPKQTGLGEGLSPEVEKAMEELCTNLV